MEEVKKAIKDPQAEKSQGDDGLLAESYKTFSDLLAPKLLEVFKDALERGSLPDSMQSAIITLIYIKDGPTTVWSSGIDDQC